MHAFENTTQSVYSHCVLLKPSGEPVPCAFCFSIRRDIFDLPSIVIGMYKISPVNKVLIKQWWFRSMATVIITHFRPSSQSYLHNFWLVPCAYPSPVFYPRAYSPLFIALYHFSTGSVRYFLLSASFFSRPLFSFGTPSSVLSHSKWVCVSLKISFIQIVRCIL